MYTLETQNPEPAVMEWTEAGQDAENKVTQSKKLRAMTQTMLLTCSCRLRLLRQDCSYLIRSEQASRGSQAVHSNGNYGWSSQQLRVEIWMEA